MEFHKRIIELSQKNSLSNQDCLEAIKLIHKSSLPFGEFLLKAGMLLNERGALMNDSNRYHLITSMLSTALTYRRWPLIQVLQKLLEDEFGRTEKKVLMNHVDINKLLLNPSGAKMVCTKYTKENLADLEANKALISIKRQDAGRDGDKDYIEELIEYIGMEPSDKEAWTELGEVYMQHFQFEKALFCFEELFVLMPNNPHIPTRIADIYYTLGGQQNLTYAKKYYSFVLSIQEGNIRALWGLKNTLLALKDLGKLDSGADSELATLIDKRLTQVYNSTENKEYLA